MTRLLFSFAIFLAAASFFPGCAQSGTPTVEHVKAPEPDPLQQAKNMLTNYANGMPVTSEAEEFSALAAKVKAKDAAKGDVLEKGLDDIKAHPTAAQTKAKELLKKL